MAGSEIKSDINADYSKGWDAVWALRANLALGKDDQASQTFDKIVNEIKTPELKEQLQQQKENMTAKWKNADDAFARNMQAQHLLGQQERAAVEQYTKIYNDNYAVHNTLDQVKDAPEIEPLVKQASEFRQERLAVRQDGREGAFKDFEQEYKTQIFEPAEAKVDQRLEQEHQAQMQVEMARQQQVAAEHNVAIGGVNETVDAVYKGQEATLPENSAKLNHAEIATAELQELSKLERKDEIAGQAIIDKFEKGGMSKAEFTQEVNTKIEMPELRKAMLDGYDKLEEKRATASGATQEKAVSAYKPLADKQESLKELYKGLRSGDPKKINESLEKAGKDKIEFKDPKHISPSERREIMKVMREVKAESAQNVSAMIDAARNANQAALNHQVSGGAANLDRDYEKMFDKAKLQANARVSGEIDMSGAQAPGAAALKAQADNFRVQVENDVRMKFSGAKSAEVQQAVTDCMKGAKELAEQELKTGQAPDLSAMQECVDNAMQDGMQQQQQKADIPVM